VELRLHLHPVDVGLGAVGVIGPGDPRAADLEFADALAVPGGDRVVGPDEPAFDADDEAALGGGIPPVVIAAGLEGRRRDRDGADRRHLGHAPRVDDRDVVLGLEGLHHRRGCSRAADDEAAARRQVGWVGLEVGQ